MKATNAQIIDAYAAHGSVVAAGRALGMCGQSVHERLVRLGAAKPINIFTDAEKTRLLAEYGAAVTSGELQKLADDMGRTRQFLCRQAGALGLTDQSRPKTQQAVKKMRLRKWAPGTHPRGMAGKNHTAASRAAMSIGQLKAWSTAKAFGIGTMSEAVRQQKSDRMSAWHAQQPAYKNFSRSKAGYRNDLGKIYFRSSWEANYARFLNFMVRCKVVESWEFEPETFWFLEIKRGTRSYLPDFRVQYANESSPVYVEVKGWMDPKSKTKIARFRKYYPQHRLEVVDAKAYRKLESQFGRSIQGWE